MRSFRPTIKNTIATLLVLPLLISLGFWQLDRAAQKRELASAFAANADKRAVEISAALLDHAKAFDWLPVSGLGSYSGPNILLDNRIKEGVVGYEVLTPMSAGGVTVLVNRGWVAAPAQRDILPELFIPPGEQTYSGKMGPAPTTGVAINEFSNLVEELSSDILRIQLVDMQRLADLIETPLAAGVVYLDADAPNGYRRDWKAPGFNPEKHQAYATQWFSMAAIVLILYISLNLRTDSKTESKVG